MTEYDALICAVNDLDSKRYIRELKDYLTTSGWLIVHEGRAVKDTYIMHFAKRTGSITSYSGDGFVHLSAVDLVKTKTIDDLLANNLFLMNKSHTELFERKSQLAFD